MRKKLFLTILIISLLTGCTIKQNQLVVIDKEAPEAGSIGNPVLGQFDITPETVSVEKYAAAIKHLSPNLFPLAVSPDFGTVFAFEKTKSTLSDSANSRIVTGNMVQEINFYAIDVNNAAGIKTVPLGKFLSIRSFQFDDKGERLAFIDGGNNVYIYELASEKLRKILEGNSTTPFMTVSWSKDGNRLMFNTRMDFDIASKQFISTVVDSYTPFIKYRVYKDKYIVQMKNKEYSDMLALFDFATRSYMTIATGVYEDSDNTNVIYTSSGMNGLKIVNLKNLESKTIETNPVYSAYIMKSTGEVLYTTLNPTPGSPKKYALIKFNAASSTKQRIEVSTPTFYLSPAEDKAYFVSSYSENSLIVFLSNLTVVANETKSDDTDLASIKDTIFRMFQLDYNYNGDYENYEKAAKKIYTNTYAPIPQEALENKLIDFKRFNTALPGNQKEGGMSANITLNAISIKNDRASVNLGLYYINAIELVKQNNVWYITGFSTYPDSAEVATIRYIVEKHLEAIKKKNKVEALKHWNENTNDIFAQAQRKIVMDLMDKSNTYNFWVGEVELWSSIEPHRAEDPYVSTDAKVKVLISDGKNIIKYKLTLVRKEAAFEISDWNSDPLSISQLN